MTADWRKRYGRFLSLVDAAAVLWAMSGALVLRFGTTQGQEWVTLPSGPYLFITVVLSALWWLMLGLSGSRETTILGYGTEEYKRLLTASFWLFGLIAMFSYVFQLEMARGYVALALPAGVGSLLLARILVRSHLRGQRNIGEIGRAHV